MTHTAGERDDGQRLGTRGARGAKTVAPASDHWELACFQRAYLSDRVRNEAYRRALKRAVSPTSFVVDLGAGTGILSLLAAQAGAGRVLGIESSRWAVGARAVVRANGFEDTVRIRRDDIRDVRLRSRADVLVHDLVGTFVWDENAGELLQHARRHIGKPGCALLPARVELHWVPLLAAGDATQFWARRREGFDFSPLAELDPSPAPELTVVHEFGDARWAAAPVSFGPFALDAPHERPSVVEMDCRIARGGRIDAVLGYMTLHLDARTRLSTSPMRPPTSWGQMQIPLDRAHRVRRGDACRLRVRTALRMRDWSAEVMA